MSLRVRKTLLLALSVLLAAVSLFAGLLLTHPALEYRTAKFFFRPFGMPLQKAEPLSGGREWALTELMKEETVTVIPSLLLVNGSHPLPDGYEAVLAEYNGARMHPAMVEPYIALRDAVQKKTGQRIYVSADFRTREEQEKILADSEAGIAAQPGCSEHEAGLALDVYAPYYGGTAFLKSPAGREVNLRCAEFGFIIRYAEEKENVTGISYEPWHLRYVGAPHADWIAESGLALEEYLEALVPEVWYEADGYRVLRTSSENVTLPEAWQSCEISPDNAGYYILTIKL